MLHVGTAFCHDLGGRTVSAANCLILGIGDGMPVSPSSPPMYRHIFRKCMMVHFTCKFTACGCYDHKCLNQECHLVSHIAIMLPGYEHFSSLQELFQQELLQKDLLQQELLQLKPCNDQLIRAACAFNPSQISWQGRRNVDVCFT